MIMIHRHSNIEEERQRTSLLKASAGTTALLLCMAVSGCTSSMLMAKPEVDSPSSHLPSSDKQNPGCDDPMKMYGVIYRTVSADGTLTYLFVESCERYMQAKSAANTDEPYAKPFVTTR